MESAEIRKKFLRFFSAKGGPASGWKERGRYIRSGVVTLRARKNGLKNTRFAFIVTGPKNRGAVLRNKTRRRLNDAVGLLMDKAPAGWDLVFLVKLIDRDKIPSFKELKSETENVLSKVFL